MPSADEARHAGDSIHTARGGAIVLSLQRCTMRCQIELCAGVIYLIRGQDTQIIELTPALATCQPRDESSETIPLSPSIIHMSDEELGCPGNYRWEIIAQWAKFQGNLKKH